ncbi:uncharacterized protein LOC126846421 [Adelges cooleyi]|uniref:uncharacterized protein LOC126846421 n=1 Tax=Adelges cooleyi TaxID=133065 RepID=UPI00217FE1DB|nr:uncharacterized protein LOC126846421 [Adelges cooleyi]
MNPTTYITVIVVAVAAQADSAIRNTKEIVQNPINAEFVDYPNYPSVNNLAYRHGPNGPAYYDLENPVDDHYYQQFPFQLIAYPYGDLQLYGPPRQLSYQQQQYGIPGPYRPLPPGTSSPGTVPIHPPVPHPFYHVQGSHYPDTTTEPAKTTTTESNVKPKASN